MLLNMGKSSCLLFSGGGGGGSWVPSFDRVATHALRAGKHASSMYISDHVFFWFALRSSVSRRDLFRFERILLFCWIICLFNFVGKKSCALMFMDMINVYLEAQDYRH